MSLMQHTNKTLWLSHFIPIPLQKKIIDFTGLLGKHFEFNLKGQKRFEIHDNHFQSIYPPNLPFMDSTQSHLSIGYTVDLSLIYSAVLLQLPQTSTTVMGLLDSNVPCKQSILISTGITLLLNKIVCI